VLDVLDAWTARPIRYRSAPGAESTATRLRSTGSAPADPATGALQVTVQHRGTESFSVLGAERHNGEHTRYLVSRDTEDPFWVDDAEVTSFAAANGKA